MIGAGADTFAFSGGRSRRMDLDAGQGERRAEEPGAHPRGGRETHR